MAVPVWATNQVLLASDVNTWFVPLVAYKTSPLTRSATGLLADPDLTLSLAANAVYEVRIMINFQNTSSTSAIQWSFTPPTGASGSYGGYCTQPGPINVSLGSTWTATQSAAASDDLGHCHNFGGTIIMSTTAGSLTYNWAPASSGAGSIELFAGSRLIAQRIG